MDKLDVRYGPGFDYPIVIQYFNAQGLELPVIGQSEDGEWLVVDLGFDQMGWVEASVVDYGGNLGALKVYAAPPVPTPFPTPVPGPSITLTYLKADSHPEKGEYILRVNLSGFARREEVRMRIIDLETGLGTRAFTIRVGGKGDREFTILLRGIESGDQIQFTGTGSEGSYAEATFHVP